jgi:hypothetical protein
MRRDKSGLLPVVAIGLALALSSLAGAGTAAAAPAKTTHGAIAHKKKPATKKVSKKKPQKAAKAVTKHRKAAAKPRLASTAHRRGQKHP